MRAIRVEAFGGPEVLGLQEVPLPEPGEGQCRIRIRAAGVNPVETYVRSGNYARKPDLPYTPGTDGAGVVDACGAGVAGFQAGDRVYLSGSITGTYAESAVCRESDMHPLPEGVSFAEGAALGIPYATACRALLQRGGAVPGETVLVHGASGGVGLAAVQFARAMGLRVFGTGGTPEGRALVRQQGADAVFDHRSEGYEERILEETSGKGVNLILEMAAHENLSRDLGLLGLTGRIVVIGSRGPIEIDPRMAMARDADIRGMILFNASPEELTEIHEAIGAGLKAGTLRPVVREEIALGDASRAHEAVMKPGSLGKFVLVP